MIFLIVELFLKIFLNHSLHVPLLVNTLNNLCHKVKTINQQLTLYLKDLKVQHLQILLTWTEISLVPQLRLQTLIDYLVNKWCFLIEEALCKETFRVQKELKKPLPVLLILTKNSNSILLQMFKERLVQNPQLH